MIPYTALAGTTGVISGTVVDFDSGKPLQDVKVTAAAPTGRYSTTTNARGFFSIAGVFADTYTISFQAEGYDSSSQTGVTLFADQTVTVNQRMSKVLQQIAKVTSRSTSSAYQPTLTVNTTTVSSQQIQNIQGTSLNISETNLLTSLPGATQDSSGYPVIHGGRENEEGFEFEGIPYTDALTNQFVNSLALPGTGVSSAQLTPGAGNATIGGSGTGTFNLVANRGTYPGFGEVIGSIGGPGFDHRLNMTVSWATPDLRFSDYLAFAGQNAAPTYGPSGTNVALLPNTYFNGLLMEADREVTNNFVWHFGKSNNQSLQFFVDIAQHDFYNGPGGLTGICFASCDPAYTSFWGPAVYGLPETMISEMSRLYPGQANAFQTLAQAGNRANGTFWQPNQAFKIEYTNALNASTYLAVKWYRVNSVVTFDFPSTNFNVNGDSVSIQGGQTTGATLSLTKQLNDKNLLEFGADYHFLHPIFGFISDSDGFVSSLVGTADQFALPYAFVPPTANCPLGAGLCGAAYAASPGTRQLIFPPFDEVANTNAQYYSLFADDKIQFSSKFNAEIGLRYNAVNYNLPNPSVDPATCTTLFAPTSWAVDPNNPLLNTNGTPIMPGNCPAATFNVTNAMVRPKIWQPSIGLAYQIAPDWAVRATYDRGAIFPSIAQVTFSENDPTAFVGVYRKLPVYNPFGVNTVPGHPNLGGTCGIVGFAVPCTSLGEQIFWAQQNFDGVPFQPVKPATSDNYQLTIQHQFSKGWLNGVAVSVSPWYRNEKNVSASVANVIVQNGQPLIINGLLQLGPAQWSNLGKESATGIDLNITRSVPIGFSFQWTASYINEFSSVIPLSSSEDFYPSIPEASLLLGNVYRVGFVSPWQSTLALEYTTKTGWRINPRWFYDIGYPSSVGETTAALINGKPFNLPNTDVIVGTSPNGPAFFIDPNNPGSFFHPNVVATTGAKTGANPGQTLSPANSIVDLTISYQHPNSKMTYGVDVGNLFNQFYNGPVYNGFFQPVATGIGGPLTGYNTNGSQYQGFPGSLPRYTSLIHGQQAYINVPVNPGRTYYFFIQARL